MERTEYDDVSHALCTTMGFFGKTIDGAAERIWFSALRQFEPKAIQLAMAEYTRRGRYAPKPVDIIELLTKQRAAKAQEQDNKPYTPCPSHIEQAWRWFIPMVAAGGVLGGFMPKVEVDLETQEKYLLIVNQQAKQFNNPEAIPAEYKLSEVWA